MKTIARLPLLAVFLSLPTLVATSSAQVPQLINYQGRVVVAGTNFSGAGQFKFALVNSNGIPTFWSNNGSSVNGSEPGAAIALTVASGLYSVLLGDATLANMTVIPATVFTNADVRLRVWFNGGSGFQQLTPDQRIAAVGYAMMSANVPDGVITSAKLADGAVTGAKLAPGTITSNALASSLGLGTSAVDGRLDIYRNATGTPGISLLGGSSQISTYGDDGLEQIRLSGTGFGQLVLRNSLANNATAVNLSAQGTTGGQLALANTNGANRALLEGENTGGLLTLYAADGSIGAVLYGNDAGAGALSLRNTNGSARFRAYGGPLDGSLELYSDLGRLTFVAEGGEGTTGSQLNMYQSNGVRTLQFDAENGVNGGGFAAVYSGDGGAAVVADADTQGGSLVVHEEDGTATIWLHNVSDSGVVSVRNSVGTETIYLWGEQSDGSGDGQIGLKKSTGTETITMQAGEGSGGAQILMRNAAGAQTVQLDSDAGGAGYLALYTTNGSAPIILDADVNGDGRITTQVLQITGGSDLSENFDINVERDTLLPGMIVSIDSKNIGELVLCHEAFDKKVAGIVSGAGGVKTGMLMGQAGTKADGKHPVALTGRVYCWVDADAGGPVEAGDLITTSNTAGHGMKVGESARASGAIIGKAMSSLPTGKGLVLVLVSLQ